ncbi:MAG: MmcQ/YjbR family DNA-binding protein [Acidobacteriota bacterium]|nr:MmcQ/YjbR family DNA-binding protein [Acidobacteriota bacterium]
MTAESFRQIALSMSNATEGSHFGHADFRVDGHIFATLSLVREGYGVLILTPEQQAGMVQDAPEVFSPVPGGWGRNGSTRVLLEAVPPDILEAALHTAWQNRVAKNAKLKKPAKLRKAAAGR